MSDKFGLDGARAILKPREAQAPATDPRDMMVDAAADRRGFVSREPAVAKRSRRKTTNEPMVNFSSRVPVSVYNQFLDFMEQEREQSYWAALQRLMVLAGVGEDGRVTPGPGHRSTREEGDL